VAGYIIIELPVIGQRSAFSIDTIDKFPAAIAPKHSHAVPVCLGACGFGVGGYGDFDRQVSSLLYGDFSCPVMRSA